MTLCAQCEASTESEERCTQCGAPPLVDGRYRLLRKLGQGANGTTYAAERLTDGQQVAIKELLVRHARSFKALELFEREARTLRALNHPGVPRYFEDFVLDTGPNVGMYLVQEFIDGRPLEGPMSPVEVLGVVRAVAATLQYLHGLAPPVVHRDIKPANLMRRRNGRVVLIDFGAVQEALGDGDSGVPTMAGTVGFMAPEQLRGTAVPASDVYGLGATAIALLEGDAALLPAANEEWTAAVTPKTRALLKAMTATSPQNRPGAAAIEAEVAEALEEAAREAERSDRRERAIARVGENLPRPLPSNFEWGSSPSELANVVGVLGGAGALAAGALALAVGPGLLIVATVVAAITAVVVGGLRRTEHIEKRRIRLFTHGNLAVGRVVGLANENAVGTLVHYEYAAAGKRHRGKVRLRAQLPPLDEIDRDILVFWDPDDPRFHRVLPELTTDHTRLV